MHKTMNDLDYEDLYREALLCLSQTCVVGEPFVRDDGTRECEVCGRLLNDDEVLERWWGHTIVRLIKDRRVDRFRSGQRMAAAVGAGRAVRNDEPSGTKRREKVAIHV